MRYKQTVIGVAWAVVRPFLTMVVFTVIFGGSPSCRATASRPIPIMVFAGMLPWFFFLGLTSVEQPGRQRQPDRQGLFPADHRAGDVVVVALVDFAINFAILVGLMLWYRFLPDWRIVLLPVFVAPGRSGEPRSRPLITALNVKYRDFRYIIPFVVQLGLYVSPVGFFARSCRERSGALYASTRWSA